MSSTAPGDRSGGWVALAHEDGKTVLCACVCLHVQYINAKRFKYNRTPRCAACTARYAALTGHKRIIQKVRNAIARCLDGNNKAYGGRGIRVYAPWITNPQLFVDYIAALPNALSELHVIDRIDNDAGYEPDNLRFSTHAESAANRRPRIRKRRRRG